MRCYPPSFFCMWIIQLSLYHLLKRLFFVSWPLFKINWSDIYGFISGLLILSPWSLSIYIFMLSPHSLAFCSFMLSFEIELQKHSRYGLERRDHRFNRQLKQRHIIIFMFSASTGEFPKLHFATWVHVKTYSQNPSLYDRLNKHHVGVWHFWNLSHQVLL